MTSYTAKLAAITTVSALLAYDALGEDLPRPEVRRDRPRRIGRRARSERRFRRRPVRRAADDDADFETPISDLVANLRHLAAALGVDWDAVNRHAAGHYAEERADRR